MRDTERKSGRDTGRGRSRLHAGSSMQDSIPGPWGHALSRRQALNCGASQVSVFRTFIMCSGLTGFRVEKRGVENPGGMREEINFHC